jgi:hypothetical protein
MRWKARLNPRLYETRVRHKFAWFPQRCENNMVCWLELYAVREECILDFEGNYFWRVVERRAI